eukprot:9640846-Alexandrium_andersonii.AAC.1
MPSPHWAHWPLAPGHRSPGHHKGPGRPGPESGHEPASAHRLGLERQQGQPCLEACSPRQLPGGEHQSSRRCG